MTPDQIRELANTIGKCNDDPETLKVMVGSDPEVYNHAFKEYHKFRETPAGKHVQPGGLGRVFASILSMLANTRIADPPKTFNGHILITKETCNHRQEYAYDPNHECPVCDWGFSVCSVCGAAEIQTYDPCPGPKPCDPAGVSGDDIEEMRKWYLTRPDFNTWLENARWPEGQR